MGSADCVYYFSVKLGHYLRFFEIARVVVRFNHVASMIIHANHGMM